MELYKNKEIQHATATTINHLTTTWKSKLCLSNNESYFYHKKYLSGSRNFTPALLSGDNHQLQMLPREVANEQKEEMNTDEIDINYV